MRNLLKIEELFKSTYLSAMKKMGVNNGAIKNWATHHGIDSQFNRISPHTFDIYKKDDRLPEEKWSIVDQSMSHLRFGSDSFDEISRVIRENLSINLKDIENKDVFAITHTMQFVTEFKSNWGRNAKVYTGIIHYKNKILHNYSKIFFDEQKSGDNLRFIKMSDCNEWIKMIKTYVDEIISEHKELKGFVFIKSSFDRKKHFIDFWPDSSDLIDKPEPNYKYPVHRVIIPNSKRKPKKS